MEAGAGKPRRRRSPSDHPLTPLTCNAQGASLVTAAGRPCTLDMDPASRVRFGAEQARRPVCLLDSAQPSRLQPGGDQLHTNRHMLLPPCIPARLRRL